MEWKNKYSMRYCHISRSKRARSVCCRGLEALSFPRKRRSIGRITFGDVEVSKCFCCKTAEICLNFTNTIQIPENKKINKLKIVSVAKIFGEAVNRVHNGESVSALFES